MPRFWHRWTRWPGGWPGLAVRRLGVTICSTIDPRRRRLQPTRDNPVQAMSVMEADCPKNFKIIPIIMNEFTGIDNRR